MYLAKCEEMPSGVLLELNPDVKEKAAKSTAEMMDILPV